MASLLATIVIPPLIALGLYLLAILVLIPLYRRHKRYAAYIQLPLSAAALPAGPAGLVARVRERLEGAKWWRQPRPGAAAASGSGELDAFVGDEELEEGTFAGESGLEGGRLRDEAEADGRRLSRDLEVGFRDDSDEEEDPRDRAVARGSR